MRLYGLPTIGILAVCMGCQAVPSQPQASAPSGCNSCGSEVTVITTPGTQPVQSIAASESNSIHPPPRVRARRSQREAPTAVPEAEIGVELAANELEDLLIAEETGAPHADEAVVPASYAAPANRSGIVNALHTDEYELPSVDEDNPDGAKITRVAALLTELVNEGNTEAASRAASQSRKLAATKPTASAPPRRVAAADARRGQRIPQPTQAPVRNAEPEPFVQPPPSNEAELARLAAELAALANRLNQNPAPPPAPAPAPIIVQVPAPQVVVAPPAAATDDGLSAKERTELSRMLRVLSSQLANASENPPRGQVPLRHKSLSPVAELESSPSAPEDDSRMILPASVDTSETEPIARGANRRASESPRVAMRTWKPARRTGASGESVKSNVSADSAAPPVVAAKQPGPIAAP